MLAREVEGAGNDLRGVGDLDEMGDAGVVRPIENLLAVRYAGVSGVITGKAIYSGSLDLKEAITFIKMNDNRCVR